MKSLVIYFSHTGENYMKNGIEDIKKGNTEIVAEKIQKLTGADLFEVERVKDYPFGYYDCCDEAKKEYESNARPEVKKTLSSIADYDVIYVGGPVWWSHLPMLMFTVLEKLDFSGKTVMPFATHEGSGLGSVMQDVKLLCKNASFGEGLAIRGHEAETSDKKLENWVR